MTNSPTSERSIDTAAAQAQVARVVRSEPFAASDRLQQFLRFIVDETLAGRGGGLKEYAIGVQVYGRGDAFDPKADSIVRSEARRLRARLATYYEGAGADDEVVIELPVGRYVPTFRLRGVGVAPPATTSPVSSPEPGEAPAPPDEQAPVGEPSRGRRAPLRALVAVLVLLGVALIVMVRAWSTTAPTHTVGLLIVPFERRAEIPVPAGALETATQAVPSSMRDKPILMTTSVTTRRLAAVAVISSICEPPAWRSDRMSCSSPSVAVGASIRSRFK